MFFFFIHNLRSRPCSTEVTLIQSTVSSTGMFEVLIFLPLMVLEWFIIFLVLQFNEIFFGSKTIIKTFFFRVQGLCVDQGVVVSQVCQFILYLMWQDRQFPSSGFTNPPPPKSCWKVHFGRGS